ncbi:hypothetical protein NB696_000613 [Xanthomonas sacchari]|uniref:hypothetical protein n=1 Tax=Xanthomonas sacchari TaxID=56458 RepID=UPI002253FF99|nr:hypothetical protein [Xanthomonas sacchari]MCW0393709.1 hypothetical protein [Xanthomonas sacchari]MCW0443741.1 hypothetical protein [Xanthomonas sacchari]MCW0465809.1 hypothetical protein [Xanthomonas sacchari]
MTSSPSSGAADQAAAPVSPKLSAEQMLSRLLTLIRTSRSVADFTPERLREVMGVAVERGENGVERYGFGEQVSPEWAHGFEVDMRAVPPRLDFGFNPVVSGASPQMGDICQIDFDQFTRQLEEMGFARQRNFDSPPQPAPGQPNLLNGRLLYDSFDRPGMHVEVYPEGEHVWTSDTGSGRSCVRTIVVT